MLPDYRLKVLDLLLRWSRSLWEILRGLLGTFTLAILYHSVRLGDMLLNKSAILRVVVLQKDGPFLTLRHRINLLRQMALPTHIEFLLQRVITIGIALGTDKGQSLHEGTTILFGCLLDGVHDEDFVVR